MSFSFMGTGRSKAVAAFARHEAERQASQPYFVSNLKEQQIIRAAGEAVAVTAEAAGEAGVPALSFRASGHISSGGCNLSIVIETANVIAEPVEQQ